ncbi:MAG: DUF2258 domain-containing protein [Desulfurococcales archaeon]|nr:DUF2258 domain-containing protein [Desulfurococcales archaeon]
MTTNTLRTGLVIAGGYADKVRRVLFAQLRDAIKSGEISNTDVARAAAELNRLLFEILVNKLNIDKGDVVRITIEYELDPPNINWKLDTLQIQAWRRLPDEEIQAKVRESLPEAEEVMKGALELGVRKLGETDTGDIVYEVTFNDISVGALLVTPLNGSAVVRGAITDPTPMVLKRTTVQVEGDIDDYIANNISTIVGKARNTEKREAQKVVREILALLGREEEESVEEAYMEE